MFQFRRFPTYTYLIQYTLTEYCSAGFPHSEISGSKVICTSPKLIAACHVLHRLLMPRHSPCALISLTYFLSRKKVGKEIFNPVLLSELLIAKLSFQWTVRFLSCFLPIKERESRIWFSLSSNYAGFRVCKIVCFTLNYLKSSTIIFVSLCCLLFILDYFVQFSRCGSNFRLKSDPNIQSLNACIQS